MAVAPLALDPQLVTRWRNADPDFNRSSLALDRAIIAAAGVEAERASLEKNGFPIDERQLFLGRTET
jgi:hypothetical protein